MGEGVFESLKHAVDVFEEWESDDESDDVYKWEVHLNEQVATVTTYIYGLLSESTHLLRAGTINIWGLLMDQRRVHTPGGMSVLIENPATGTVFVRQIYFFWRQRRRLRSRRRWFGYRRGTEIQIHGVERGASRAERETSRKASQCKRPFEARKLQAGHTTCPTGHATDQREHGQFRRILSAQNKLSAGHLRAERKCQVDKRKQDVGIRQRDRLSRFTTVRIGAQRVTYRVCNESQLDG